MDQEQFRHFLQSWCVQKQCAFQDVAHGLECALKLPDLATTPEVVNESPPSLPAALISVNPD